jgi:thiamine-monophosphate kinase
MAYETIRDPVLTTVLMASENQLIERTRRKIPSYSRGELRLGIGDDAAIFRPHGSGEWVVTTDAFLENVHFLVSTHSPKAVGYKALARATSDIAAMGAQPSFFLMNVGLPGHFTGNWYCEFLAGIGQAARRFGLVLAGGDTTKYPQVLINLTILGKVPDGKAILRSGARPGDLICVSGRLGEAELGLRLIQMKLHKQKKWKKFLRKHFQPEPRLELGTWLRKGNLASAMIDTSDGLSTDLGHICEASGVGARIRLRMIPGVAVPEALRKRGIDPALLALHGGDDYELLFTVPPRMAKRLSSDFHGLPLTVVGEITEGRRIDLIDPAGHAKPLGPRGWDPFRRST